jgi:NADH:ubiquinone oxidoreductase subunit E
MAEKISVGICTGTACYVMGASDILLLEENLPASLKDRVEISGATCLAHCKDIKNGKPPFVTINGDVMAQASLPKVLNRLREIVNAEHQQ